MSYMNNKIPTTQADRFIKSPNKCIRVLAGPGTGKSFSLCQRFRYLVEHAKIVPEKILVLTFTSVTVQD